ncbi:MAG: NAD(P)/FAD-dependent oxidoreductase [Acidobacteria bacterium]|nr:NAD(P)/FAD-dependent oxidoreductase [Acidobacteriota bacterium]
MSTPDVVVVGAGPNGLAAAVTMARAGLDVLVVEGADRPGGAARTEEVTLPGFRHDLGAAVHPMALASPFLRRFGLTDRVPFLVPEVSYAHPFDDGGAAIAWRDLDRTATGLGADGPAYRRLLEPLVDRAREIARFTLGPMVRVPHDPVTVARFGLAVLDQGTPGWNRRWRGRDAPALLTGVMAHTVRPMPSLPSAGAGLALAVQAHAVGWPIPVGGTGAIVDALVQDLLAHGGRVETGRPVARIDELPRARAIVFDTSVPALLGIAGRRLPPVLRAWLRTVRFGAGVGKVDFALDGPVPWLEATARIAVTLHLGGARAAVAEAERTVAARGVPERPYVLVAQPSVLDPTRAPAGKHVLWAYTHLPNGSTLDPTDLISEAIERVAPGFRDLVLASNARSAADIGAWDPNLGGGDLAAGAVTLRQLLARPIPSPDPWHLAGGIYLCSAAAAPGPGVHGQGGYLAARSVLRREFGVVAPPSLR